jgi:hypothetical protein
LLAGLIVLALIGLAWHFNLPPRDQAFRAWPDALRVIAASVVLFTLGGFGLVRLLLPARLRRYELLWVLPTGACAVGLALTVLGFAGVPYAASLPLVALAGLAVGAYAVRRRGWPEAHLPHLSWPCFLALAVLFVALVPMLFKQHYAAPVGTGSDAHVAAGVAQFLKHDYPTSVDVTQPVNQMQPTWQSKYPIYYAFAAVSTVSGLATWQVLATLAAVLLALTAIGMFLVAREVFGASLVVALGAMCFAVLDRAALHVVLTPFFNQTWGFFTLPFTIVLGWIVVQPGMGRRERAGAIGLLAIIALVLILAYPLEAPIPAIPLIVFAVVHRRRRIAAGERVLRLRDLYRGRRSILWMVPLAVLLAVPVAGAVEKAAHGVLALAPGRSLSGWTASTGYRPGFVPWNFFFGLPNSIIGIVLLAAVLVLAAWGLARQSRPLAGGLGAVLILGLLLALYLRHRQYGFYFEFKLLAFLGPLVLVLAVVGAARLRWLGAALLVPLAIAVAAGAVSEIGFTGFQLETSTIQLAQWARTLPRGATIRLDMWPPWELWTAYFLSSHPVCSQQPLLGGSYPHVAISRKADYIVATRPYGRPADAVGPPLRQNRGYRLYRENPSVPGPDLCSRRRFFHLYKGFGYSPT